MWQTLPCDPAVRPGCPALLMSMLPLPPQQLQTKTPDDPPGPREPLTPVASLQYHGDQNLPRARLYLSASQPRPAAVADACAAACAAACSVGSSPLSPPLFSSASPSPLPPQPLLLAPSSQSRNSRHTETCPSWVAPSKAPARRHQPPSMHPAASQQPSVNHAFAYVRVCPVAAVAGWWRRA